MKDIKELYEEIDRDDGLKSKRKVLNITSVILLAIQFTGTKVIEANTFIFKISFQHQDGVALLLMLTISFFLVRYYNYAKPYHNEIYLIWSDKLLKDDDIDFYCYHSRNVSGFLHENYPKDFNIDDYLYQEADSHLTYTTSYECKFIFVRYFCFIWNSEYAHDDNFSRVNIFKNLGFIKYLIILGKEFKYQFSRYFTHRENLDILGPYLLGFLAISSYTFDKKFNLILSYIL